MCFADAHDDDDDGVGQGHGTELKYDKYRGKRRRLQGDHFIPTHSRHPGCPESVHIHLVTGEKRNLMTRWLYRELGSFLRRLLSLLLHPQHTFSLFGN